MTIPPYFSIARTGVTRAAVAAAFALAAAGCGTTTYYGGPSTRLGTSPALLGFDGGGVGYAVPDAPSMVVPGVGYPYGRYDRERWPDRGQPRPEAVPRWYDGDGRGDRDSRGSSRDDRSREFSRDDNPRADG